MKYNKKVANPIWYKYTIIWKALQNASGVKYYEYKDNGIVRADTLKDIKRLLK